MSVSFTWKPVDPNDGISWGAGSKLHSILEEVFGGFPITLSKKDVGVLRGISASGYKEVDELINAINEHRDIEIEAHW